jgi:tetratricopeptide (TPR) repeat protein
MKALEKDRARRYETANGLARDIERYLHDEPVVACPPSAAYRFRKFARRHRAGLLMASGALIALVLLVISLAVSNRMIARERNETARALTEKEEALKLAEAESKRAEQNFRRASITISDTVTKAAMGVGEFSSLPLPVRKRFAEETAKFNESLMQQDLHDPDLHYEAAVGHRSMGTLQSTFGDTQKAEQLMRRSVQMLDQLASEHPTVTKYRHQLAWSCHCLGRNLNATSRADEAMSYFEKSAKLYEALLKEEPASPNYRNELITCCHSLVNAYRAKGDPKSAEELLLRITALLNLSAQHQDEAAHKEQLARFHFSLAEFRVQQGRADQARASFREAAKLCESAFPKRQTASLLYLWAASYYGLMDYATGLAEVEQAYQKILDIRSRVPAGLKDHPDLRKRFGHAQRVWAYNLWGAGRLREAEEEFLEAATIFEKLTDDDPAAAGYRSFAADSHRQVGKLMMLGSRNDEAERELRRSVEIHEQGAAKFPDQQVEGAALAYFDLAQLLMKTGRPEEASALNKRAVTVDDPCSHNEIAWRLVTDPDPTLRNPKLAVELAERAIAALPGNRMIWNTLAVAHYRNGQWKEAIAAFDKSMEVRNGGDANDWFFLAMCHWQLGEKDEARKWYDKAVEWTEKNQPKNKQLLRFRTEAEELLKIADTQPATKAEPK